MFREEYGIVCGNIFVLGSGPNLVTFDDLSHAWRIFVDLLSDILFESFDQFLIPDGRNVATAVFGLNFERFDLISDRLSDVIKENKGCGKQLLSNRAVSQLELEQLRTSNQLKEWLLVNAFVILELLHHFENSFDRRKLLNQWQFDIVHLQMTPAHVHGALKLSRLLGLAFLDRIARP